MSWCPALTLRETCSQSEMFRRVPTVYMWDDHDYGPNNADGTFVGKEVARYVHVLTVGPRAESLICWCHAALPTNNSSPTTHLLRALAMCPSTKLSRLAASDTS